MTGVNLRNNLRQSDTVREEVAVIDWSLGKAAQTESGPVVTGWEVGRTRTHCVVGRASHWRRQVSSGIDGSDGCSTIWTIFFFFLLTVFETGFPMQP